MCQTSQDCNRGAVLKLEIMRCKYCIANFMTSGMRGHEWNMMASIIRKSYSFSRPDDSWYFIKVPVFVSATQTRA
jgi:hypothetical protein